MIKLPPLPARPIPEMRHIITAPRVPRHTCMIVIFVVVIIFAVILVMYMHIDMQTYRHTDIQTYRRTDVQT